MTMSRRLTAELLGTFWLVFGGCGAAVLAGNHIGLVGISLAFGLTVLTMAYAIGHVSGCHLNPAVTLGLVAAGRFKMKDVPAYVIAQLAGACLAALAIKGIALEPGNLAANGFGEHSPSAGPLSPAGYGLAAAFAAEALLTFFFLLIICGSTHGKAPAGFAPIAIGLGLALIHLIGIPVTNVSVNPARSTGPALFAADAWPLQQLWLFWVAPIAGGLAAGLVSRFLSGEPDLPPRPMVTGDGGTRG